MKLACCSFRIVILYLFYHLLSVQVYAEETSIESQLESIAELQDRGLALSKLKPLLASNSMKSEEKFSVFLATMLTHQELNDLDSALTVAHQALAFADDQKLLSKVATAHKMVGIFYYFRGENKPAIASYQKALKQFIQLDLPVQQANVYNNMGLVYATMGETVKALNVYQSADALYQMHGDELDKVDIRYNIAGLHLHLGRYDIATEMLLEVIEKRLEMDDDDDLVLAYANIGLAYRLARNFEASKHYTNLAFDYYMGQKNYYGMANQYQTLASIHHRSKDYEKGAFYAHKAIEFSDRSGHKKVFSGGLYERAIASFLKGKVDAALDDLSLSEQNAQQLSYKPIIVAGLAIKALSHAAKHDFTKALQMLYDYQYETMRLNSVNLNQQLAQFEAEQLSHQIKELEQTKQLQEFEQQVQTRQWQYMSLLSAFVIVLLFLMYRRRVELELKARLEVEVKQRTIELEVANKKLSELSFLDNVTALNNRRSFDLDIIDAWRKSTRDNSSFFLGLVSIDNFERFNERYGHLAGDDVARMVANAIKEHHPSGHKVYRFSNDEFAIIIEDMDLDSALSLINNVILNIYERSIEHQENESGVVTLSAGLCASNDTVQTIEQLVDKTDQRVYIAKKNGRNRVVAQVIPTRST